MRKPIQNHKFHHKLLFTAVVLIIALFSFSCTIEENIIIKTDDSGNSTFEVKLQQFFLDVVKDYSTFLPEEDAEMSQVNGPKIEESLNEYPYLSDVEVIQHDKTHVTGSFTFTNAADIMRKAEESDELDVFTYTSDGDRQSVNIYIDKDNYMQLKDIAPILEDPAFSTFGPEENEDVTEEEYYELVSYMLGEDGPGAIRTSDIRISIEADRPIISQSGGEQVSENKVIFKAPLIDFLLLHNPLQYSVTW